MDHPQLENPDWLRQEYASKPLQEIANNLGVHRNTVRDALIRYGIERRSRGAHFAGKPKPPGQRAKMAATRRSFWKNLDANRRSEIATNISLGKGGDGQSESYVYTYLPDGRRVRYHRWLMEQLIGRPLLPTEAVHHRDGNPRNNSPENLEVMNHGTHTILHHTKGGWQGCEICGEPYWVKPSHSKLRMTCSRRCAHVRRWGPRT